MGNFDVNLKEYISFDANVEELHRRRVLEELSTKHTQQKDLALKLGSTVSSNSITPWRFGGPNWIALPVKVTHPTSSSSLTSYPELAELTVMQEAMVWG